MWYHIEEFGQDKADAWLCRVDGRFISKAHEQIAKGKKPNLQNMEDAVEGFRDNIGVFDLSLGDGEWVLQQCPVGGC